MTQDEKNSSPSCPGVCGGRGGSEKRGKPAAPYGGQRLKMIRPVVLIDEIPFHELDFDGSLTLLCQDPVLRDAENFLRRKLFQWRHFPADMILPPYFPVQKIMYSTGDGITVRENTLATEAANHIVSHAYHDQLETEADLEKFRLPVVTYDREETMARYNRIGEVFGDILPVRITGHNCYVSTWDDIARNRGVTALLIDLADRPEFTHKIVSKMTGLLHQPDRADGSPGAL